MVALPERISPTIAAIDAYYESKQDLWYPKSISVGKLGHNCERFLWYQFRWVSPPKPIEGRILRLFQTGHREESRMIGDLQNAGIEVRFRDFERNGKQFAVEAVDGHLQGRLDGFASNVPEVPKADHVLEIKTHNEKSFAQLTRHGVEIAQPMHVAQVQVCMHLTGLTRALYLAKNKNTDALYVERIKYDAAHSEALVAKATRVKEAVVPPERVSEKPESFQCRFCHQKEVCHYGKWPLRNCRTCLHSEPIPHSNWFCHRHKTALLKEQQEKGCPNHLYLPSLVPGEQIDADEKTETVTYRMHNGSEWVDGHKEELTT